MHQLQDKPGSTNCVCCCSSLKRIMLIICFEDAMSLFKKKTLEPEIENAAEYIKYLQTSVFWPPLRKVKLCPATSEKMDLSLPQRVIVGCMLI